MGKDREPDLLLPCRALSFGKYGMFNSSAGVVEAEGTGVKLDVEAIVKEGLAG